ncbi:MAG TPA: hypothetical protein VJI15_01905 [Candidatus Nanoarchaeia archaeon]|nr:hypothetical protein [Candidatus Nanoarchaeia archaeon]
MGIETDQRRAEILTEVIAVVRDTPIINERGVALELRRYSPLPSDLRDYATSLETAPRQLNQVGLLDDLQRLTTEHYQ